MRAAFVLSMLVLGALAAACKPQEHVLVVAAVRQPATSLFFVATAAGCFTAERLRVQESTFELGRDALATMLDRRADVAIAYETPVLRAAYAAPLRVLTQLHTSTRNTRLIALRDSGIREFADLGGKRVGVAAGTNADFYSEVVLTFGGVSRDAVEFVDLPPERSVEALIARRIDAAILSDPGAQAAERSLGADSVVLPTELYVETSLLVTRPDVTAAHRPALEALLRGLSCAERIARTEPERALALIRGRFPEQDEPQLRDQLARVHWGLGLENLLLEVLRRESEWLGSSGAVRGAAPVIERMVDPSVLEQVYPESVMLLPLDVWRSP